MSEVQPDVSGIQHLTAQVVSAHVGGNTVAADDLPSLIQAVSRAFAGLGKAAERALVATTTVRPFVSVKKSIQPDHLVCLEDGAKVTMLKRYLSRRFGLTPDQYRAKWELPSNYPMVAPNYSARRSVLAKELGLGRKPKTPQPEAAPQGKRGRKAA